MIFLINRNKNEKRKRKRKEEEEEKKIPRGDNSNLLLHE